MLWVASTSAQMPPMMGPGFGPIAPAPGLTFPGQAGPGVGAPPTPPTPPAPLVIGTGPNGAAVVVGAGPMQGPPSPSTGGSASQSGKLQLLTHDLPRCPACRREFVCKNALLVLPACLSLNSELPKTSETSFVNVQVLLQTRALLPQSVS